MAQVMQLRTAFTTLPRRAQLAILGVALLTVLVLVFVVKAATNTTYVTVAEGMQPAKASEAQKALEDAGIPYKLGVGAASIQVPEDREPAATVALSSVGVSAAGGGSHSDCEKTFSKQGLMASTSDTTAMQKRTCLQNEIANKIEGIDGVESANVSLVMPDTELFSSDQNPATAAISVNTGGSTLAASQVRAIVDMTSKSVKNLDAEHVSIVDDSGKLLTSATDGVGGSMDEAQLKLKIESLQNQQIEARFTQQLEKIAGTGNVAVASNVELDMDKVRREVKDYGGDTNAQGPKSSESTDDETLINGGSTTGGTAGTGSNVGVDPASVSKAAVDSGTTGGSKYSHPKATLTYNNDEVAEAIEKAPGSTIRNRISVTVDDSVKPEVAAAVKDQVQALMGGDAQDSFSFAQVPMPEPAELGTGGNGGSALATRVAPYIKWFVLAIGMIGLALFLRRSLEDRTRELLEPADLLLLEPGSTQPIPLADLEAAVASAVSLDSQKRRELARRVDQIAQSKPENVANQLRSWLRDRETPQIHR